MLIRTTTVTGQGVPQVDTSVRGADFRGHQRGLSWPPVTTSDGQNRGLSHGHGHGAPVTVTGTPGDSQVVVAWVPPGNEVATGVASYTATVADLTSPGANGDESHCSAVVPTDGTSESDTCTITGLTNGDCYSISVVATNGNGIPGPSGLSSPPVVPSAG